MRKIPLLLLFSLANTILAGTFSGTVISVTDGDTIKLLKADKTQVKIRLYGIDTPESKQAYGTKAKQALSTLVFGKAVTIKDHGKDRYGRTIGTVYVAKTKVNLKMVQDGWAWHYKQYSKDKDLADAEVAARKAKKGLWQGNAPVAPWEWRRSGRKAKDTPEAEVSKETPTVQGKYWLNLSSKVVHSPKCRNYGKTKKGRYSDVIPDGFRHCKLCD